MQSIQYLEDKTVTYTASTKESKKLDRGHYIRELALRLSGTLTCVLGNNTAAATLRGDEWAVVKAVRIKLDSQTVLVELDGPALRWHQRALYGVMGRRSVEMGDGTADPVFNSTVLIPFIMPRSRSPLDTILDARFLQNLHIEVEWGSHLDINAGSTGFTVAPSIEVAQYASQDPSGDLDKIGLPFGSYRRWKIESAITAATGQFEVELPAGPIYRGFLINVVDSAADDGTVINRAKLVSGSRVFVDLSEEMLADLWHTRYALEHSFTGAAYDDLLLGNNNSAAGWYYVDLVGDGSIRESIFSRGMTEMKWIFDVNAGTAPSLRIYPQAIYPRA